MRPTASARTSRSAGAAEVVAGAAGLAGLLDLLEDRTGVSYDDLWRTWVARPADLPLLDARKSRTRNTTAFVSSAGDWLVPLPIRDAMRAWRFDHATALIDGARSCWSCATKVHAAANAAGLRPGRLA